MRHRSYNLFHYNLFHLRVAGFNIFDEDETSLLVLLLLPHECTIEGLPLPRNRLIVKQVNRLIVKGVENSPNRGLVYQRRYIGDTSTHVCEETCVKHGCVCAD